MRKTFRGKNPIRAASGLKTWVKNRFFTFFKISKISSRRTLQASRIFAPTSRGAADAPKRQGGRSKAHDDYSIMHVYLQISVHSTAIYPGVLREWCSEYPTEHYESFQRATGLPRASFSARARLFWSVRFTEYFDFGIFQDLRESSVV
jgi:hypothetical protein